MDSIKVASGTVTEANIENIAYARGRGAKDGIDMHHYRQEVEKEIKKKYATSKGPAKTKDDSECNLTVAADLIFPCHYHFMKALPVRLMYFQMLLPTQMMS